MGKFKSSITPKRWLQLKHFFPSSPAFGRLQDGKNFYSSVFLLEVIKEKATVQ